MKLRNIAIATVGMVLLAFTSFAQVATLEGNVKGVDGKPVQGAVVKITRTDIKGEYPTKTDKKGHYIYMGLPYGGTFNVTLFIDGKQVETVPNIRTSGEIRPVDFDLKATQKDNSAKQAEYQKAIETGKISDELARSMSAADKAKMEKDIKDKAEKMKKSHELNAAFNEGMAAKDAKQWDAAAAAFTKASENDPTQQAVWAQLGEVYSKLAETKTGPEFDATIQKGLDAYVKAIELKPDDPASHNNYALALAKAKKFNEAQAELKKAADLDPANGGKYFYNLGALLVNAGQADASGEAFKKAIELTPTYADSYYQYGTTLSAKETTGPDGKIVAAPGEAEAFKKYLELQPTGQYADGAKAMLEHLGSSVETKFQNPNAPKKSTTTKKKQ